MTTVPISSVNVRRHAGEWFLGSGIRESSGGVARYYYSDRACNAPLTTEITAYSASCLVEMQRETGDPAYGNAAVDAARYLVSAWDSETSAMPYECDGQGGQCSYFFDNGIIVRGLLAVWRESKAPEFLAMARLVADSMGTDFFDGGQVRPILQLPSKQPAELDAQRWSRSSGCYQLKAALAWEELWEITQEARYHDLYIRLLQISLAQHSSFLPGIENELGVMDRLHAYCYFLEGLLPQIHEDACRQAMIEGIARVEWFVAKLSPYFLRSDVVAQLLRARLFADEYGVQPLDVDVGRREAAILQSFQSEDPDPRLNGGYWFGRKGDQLLPFMNPVSTAFCHQALSMWNRRGQEHPQWQRLI
jgi:hypothetical protein